MKTNDFSTEITVIPEITDPLGKYYDQPATSEIILNGDLALMNRTTFEKLHNYSSSRPSALYIGKMWKSKVYSDWVLRWCDVSDKGDGYTTIQMRIIVVSK